MRLSSLRPFLLPAIAAVAFISGATALERWSIARLLTDDARATGIAWTRFLKANTTDIDQIAACAPPSADTVAFLAQMKSVSRIFR